MQVSSNQNSISPHNFERTLSNENNTTGNILSGAGNSGGNISVKNSDKYDQLKGKDMQF
jgi:hypothetical protein